MSGLGCSINNQDYTVSNLEQNISNDQFYVSPLSLTLQVEDQLDYLCSHSSITAPPLQVHSPFLSTPNAVAQKVYQEVYCLTKIRFDYSNPAHVLLLNSLYYAITGSPVFPDKLGDHWIALGFQTNDPIRDLRAVGLLGLFLPLVLFTKRKSISENIYLASHKKDHDFPLMLVLIVDATSVLDATKETNLIRNAQTENEAWNKIHAFYAGIVNEQAERWVKGNCTFFANYNLFHEIMTQAKKDAVKIAKKYFN